MIRVTDFKMDGLDVTFKIASLDVSQADEFVKKSKEMLARGSDVTSDEWLTRQVQIVCDSLNRAGMEGFTKETIRHQLDLPTLGALYLKILEFSGLRPGEAAAAASPLPKSAAA